MNSLTGIRNLLEKILLTTLKAFLVVAFSTACILFLLNLVLRTFAGINVSWFDPLVQYLFVVSGLMGAAYAAKTNENIKIELLRGLAGKKIVKVIRLIVSTLITGVILYVFTAHLAAEWHRQIESNFHLKTWVLDIPYIFLFLVSFFYYIVSCVELISTKGAELR